jgi:hypothetical protein
MPRLTDRFLAALPVDKDRLVFDTVSPGLGVRATAKGKRTFIRTGPNTCFVYRAGYVGPRGAVVGHRGYGGVYRGGVHRRY